MSQKEATKITNFSKCDFTRIHQYYMEKAILRKAMTKEEKLQKKEENEQAVEEYGWCIIDRHRERIGNFRIEPPGLFRGRGDHPKQGRIKVRISWFCDGSSYLLWLRAWLPDMWMIFLYEMVASQ